MPHRLASFLFVFGLTLSVFGASAGSLTLWQANGTSLLPGGSATMAAGAALIVLALVLVRFSWRRLELYPADAALGPALVFLSDWLVRSYSFFQGPSIRGEILLLSFLSLFIVRRENSRFWTGYLIAALALVCSCFFVESGGRLLFSDDHTVFFFRLSLLRENFPSIPFYYPLWNAGLDARDFFATGALNIFFLGSPLLYMASPERVYNVLVLLIAFGLTPLATWYAARLHRLPQPIPAIAALLSITLGLIWCRWAFKYGTMGFLTTAALLPLNLSLCAKQLYADGGLTRKELALAVCSLSLMFLWAPSLVTFVPVALLAASKAGALVRQPKVVVFVCVLTAVNLPWMAMLWSVSNVGNFLNSEKASHGIGYEQSLAPDKDQPAPAAYRHKTSGLDWRKSLTVFRETSFSSNPLLLFLGLPGLFLLPFNLRRVLFPSATWLLILGTVVVPLKPQLEFDRMLVLMLLVLCIPCAAALQKLFKSADTILARGLTAICAGFLLCGPFSTGSMLRNRTLEHYDFASPVVRDLSAAIKTFGGSGRVFFSGFVLHELDNGHLAPLSILSGRPLVASSPFHNVWRYTQSIPRDYMNRGEAGIEEYLDVLNITAVFAHERMWRDYFGSRPERYRQIWQGGRFVMYQRLQAPNSYILSGQGEFISQDSRSFRIRALSPLLLLSFRYFPFLKSSHCVLTPQRVSPELTLVALADCPVGAEVEVRSISPWQRLFQGRTRRDH